MNRRRADLILGSLVVGVLLLGGALSWDAYRQQRALGELMASMMGGGDVGVHGTNPIWFVLGTLLVSAIILGFYALLRPGVERAGDASRSEEPVAGTAGGHSKGSVSDSSGLSRPEVLSVLPDDERRILEPVVDSPGITQIALRDRSNFSKSKVSQTVSELEKRGLLYRERQGRTYRVYPSEEL